MIVPQEGPHGLQVFPLGNGGVRISVATGRSWWQVWKPWFVEIDLDMIGMVWVYQVMAKHMRRRVVPADFNELAWDLEQAHQNLSRSLMGHDALVAVASSLAQKGWVKT